MLVACLMVLIHPFILQEAVFGEQVSTLQQELEQLHDSAANMKVHLEAAQQSQTDAQVLDPCLAAISMLLVHCYGQETI